MSKEEDRIKNSRRRQQDGGAINKQVKIAKTNHVDVTQPHKFAKHRAMNCGDPKCVMCANPRRTFKQLTAQEQRLFQDLDSPNDRHSNGLPPKQD